MKRRLLLRRLAEAAQDKGGLTLVRTRGDHDVYRVKGRNIIVAHHADIPEPTARAAIRLVEGL